MKTIDKIKRLAVRRKLKFTFKAECELLRDGLTQDDIIESIINAPDIKKELKSTVAPGDMLYVIESPNFDGLWIYTKGKLMKNGSEFYVLISSKLAE
ncbi:MAG: hypothetical protein HY537_05575 [Deltaproteobacteria bacterium]|nr:hypothetical protein [Deltaproteobacteria bacterium]